MEKDLLSDKGKRVDYSGVGRYTVPTAASAAVTVHVKDDKILYIDGRDQPPTTTSCDGRIASASTTSIIPIG